jgi:hypothetical protein
MPVVFRIARNRDSLVFTIYRSHHPDPTGIIWRLKLRDHNRTKIYSNDKGYCVIVYSVYSIVYTKRYIITHSLWWCTCNLGLAEGCSIYPSCPAPGASAPPPSYEQLASLKVPLEQGGVSGLSLILSNNVSDFILVKFRHGFCNCAVSGLDQGLVHFGTWYCSSIRIFEYWKIQVCNLFIFPPCYQRVNI